MPEADTDDGLARPAGALPRTRAGRQRDFTYGLYLGPGDRPVVVRIRRGDESPYERRRFLSAGRYRTEPEARAAFAGLIARWRARFAEPGPRADVAPGHEADRWRRIIAALDR